MTADEPLDRHFLYPGTIFAEPGEYLISTVLGSCVAVCMWNKVAHVGGMNHIMLPYWNGEGLATPKYGNIAMEKLLGKMLAIGGRRENLVAKVFGGANVSGTGLEMYMIGDRNTTLVSDMLEEFRIPVVAKDIGGRVGRKIIMNSSTGVVLVSKGRRAAPDE
ncbi:MAG: chemotaxis protein CheD [Desulfuromonadaceae bacterium]|nr:chemotaxis protein CheD [Desulfuromonadaceae bacterium]MDD5105286.1 chemotaxis protein CheD [Desulfuromonadaceae bacterium]